MVEEIKARSNEFCSISAKDIRQKPIAEGLGAALFIAFQPLRNWSIHLHLKVDVKQGFSI